MKNLPYGDRLKHSNLHPWNARLGKLIHLEKQNDLRTLKRGNFNRRTVSRKINSDSTNIYVRIALPVVLAGWNRLGGHVESAIIDKCIKKEVGWIHGVWDSVGLVVQELPCIGKTSLWLLTFLCINYTQSVQSACSPTNLVILPFEMDYKRALVETWGKVNRGEVYPPWALSHTKA